MALDGVPKELLECPDKPVTPAYTTATQKDIAVYLVQLNQAYDGCRADVDSMRALFRK